MPTCDICGGEIVFRYVDGRPTPIHTSGGWCSGSRTNVAAPRMFSTVVSYVNPNARCPVCSETVYFYQSSYGGRVFFDNLEWPWPKHRCTDNPRAQSTKHIETLTLSFNMPFRNKDGETLHLYELDFITSRSGMIEVRFRQIQGSGTSFRSLFPKFLLEAHDIALDDLRNAPSFVVRRFDDHRLVEFISVRKKKIDLLRLPRMA